MPQTKDPGFFLVFVCTGVFVFIQCKTESLETMPVLACFEKWTDPPFKNSTCTHLMLNLLGYINLSSDLSI